MQTDLAVNKTSSHILSESNSYSPALYHWAAPLYWYWYSIQTAV